MLITAPFERCTFRVEAVRVTTTNLAEIAEWCGGRVVETRGYEPGRCHVQVPAGPDGKAIARAHVGNWVTCLDRMRSFRVYKEKSFLEAFRGIMSDTEKYAKVHEMLMKIRNAQDTATYWGQGSEGVLILVDQTAKKLCEMM